MEDDNLNELNAISPIDGRYRNKVSELAQFSSEEALMKHRVEIECKYLAALMKNKIICALPSQSAVMHLDSIIDFFSEQDAERIKEIEKTTNHDVKAVEYFLREKFKETDLEKYNEKIHIGLTSEDVNNLAYTLMLKKGTFDVCVPAIKKLEDKLADLADEYNAIPMLARTHGQPASPTTLGKEIANFAYRIFTQRKKLEKINLPGKLNGATGNYNAHTIAYPDVDWIQFSSDFVSSLGLEPNLITTQIEPHDGFVELFQGMTRVNNVVLNLDQDIWRYISDNYILQKPKEGEIGSSTMPHKVNPIDFENSEGNLGMANSMFNYFINKLPVSRLQRDLSDSTVSRNFGTALAYSLLAYKSTLKGLGKIHADLDYIPSEVKKHPEVLTEAVQTVMRAEDVPEGYEKMKELSRGKKITNEDLKKFVKSLPLNDDVKERLSISPLEYIGEAIKLTHLAVDAIRNDKEINYK